MAERGRAGAEDLPATRQPVAKSQIVLGQNNFESRDIHSHPTSAKFPAHPDRKAGVVRAGRRVLCLCWQRLWFGRPGRTAAPSPEGSPPPPLAHRLFAAGGKPGCRVDAGIRDAARTRMGWHPRTNAGGEHPDSPVRVVRLPLSGAPVLLWRRAAIARKIPTGDSATFPKGRRDHPVYNRMTSAVFSRHISQSRFSAPPPPIRPARPSSVKNA